ncbi:hypothetical protein Patl1_10571 [Pistacia atlantica]|uniref:Uncharacterized protein n=1 Tax=Pistacia atlantica TaxID=434234 RepID=A0ACC1A697_9ROSI|nr:hypothetical protein Patl1_10571 [Pistacia atlantica]
MADGVPSLANHFSRTVDVVLRGYSGYNTRWALKVIQSVFSAEKDGGGEGAPVAVTVFFGANDACIPDRCSAFQHVPVHEYKQNLHSIISYLKVSLPSTLLCISINHTTQLTVGLIYIFLVLYLLLSCVVLFYFRCAQNEWPTTLILLITPPPIDEEARLSYPYVENPMGLPERTNEAAGAYAKACVEIATECGIPVIDLWTKMQQFPDWEKTHLRDGLHLAQTGNRIVFEEVVAKLKKEGLSLEKLPVDLPLISEIDPNEPLKAFQK